LPNVQLPFAVLIWQYAENCSSIDLNQTNPTIADIDSALLNQLVAAARLDRDDQKGSEKLAADARGETRIELNYFDQFRSALICVIRGLCLLNRLGLVAYRTARARSLPLPVLTCTPPTARFL